MTDLNRVLWRCVVVSLAVGAAACGAPAMDGNTEAPLGSVESTLACTVNRDCAGSTPVGCSSLDGVCNSGPDNGGWVQCDGAARLYCEVPPACTCGSEQFTVVRRATGTTCGEAYDAANKLADTHITASCPAGGCNITRTLMSCSPAGPGPHPSFSMGVSVTYSCNEPVGCQ